MKLSALSSYNYSFKGFASDLKRAHENLKSTPELGRYLQDGRTVIIERVELKEDNSTKAKLKKVGEGAVTAGAAGATGGVVAKTKDNFEHASNAADTASDVADNASEAVDTATDTINDTTETIANGASTVKEAIREKLANTTGEDMDEKIDLVKSIFNFAKEFAKSVLDLD